MPSGLSHEIISAAIDGLEEKRRRLDVQIGELRAMLPGSRRANSAPADTSEPASGKRKKFSAASRRKMALAQKARWARMKGQSGAPKATTPAAPKKKRKMSAEGRQAIAEATRKRWEAYRAAKAAPKKGLGGRKKAAAKKAAASATQAAE